jgi:hypothetical protein
MGNPRKLELVQIRPKSRLPRLKPLTNNPRNVTLPYNVLTIPKIHNRPTDNLPIRSNNRYSTFYLYL